MTVETVWSLDQVIDQVMRLKTARRAELLAQAEQERAEQERTEQERAEAWSQGVARHLEREGVSWLIGFQIRSTDASYSTSRARYWRQMWFTLPGHTPVGVQLWSHDQLNWSAKDYTTDDCSGPWVAVIDSTGHEESFTDLADALIAAEQL